MLMPIVCAALYTLGAFIYYLHQLTVIHFMGEDDEEFSEFKVRFNCVIWPYRVAEIMVELLFFSGDKDE